MDEKLREVLARQVRMCPSQKGYQQGYQQYSPCLTDDADVSIRLSKANLARIKPGMYWYEDDTVSKRLSSSKTLKSIVLFVRENIIYGDTFEQRYMLGQRVGDYLADVQTRYRAQFKFGKVCRPQVADLQNVYSVLSDINAACKKAQKPKWSEEIYFTEALSEERLSWVDMFDGEEGKMSNEKGAYFRPLIAFIIA